MKWYDIKGYEGFYKINKNGDVRSLDRITDCGKYKRKEKGIIIKQRIRNGYKAVSLNKNGKSKSFNIHRLIAINFIKNENNKPCINHIDGNKLNNEIYNLEWVTHKENNNHAIKLGLSEVVGSKNKNSKLTEKDVIDMRKLSRFFSQVELSKIFEVSTSNVQFIVNNKTWKHI